MAFDVTSLILSLSHCSWNWNFDDIIYQRIISIHLVYYKNQTEIRWKMNLYWSMFAVNATLIIILQSVFGGILSNLKLVNQLIMFET